MTSTEPAPGSAAGVAPAYPDLGPTADEMIAAIATRTDLTLARRRDLMAAIRRFCRLVGKDPATVRIAPPQLRAAFADLHPATTGMAAKSLANTRALLLAATREAGPGPRPGQTLAPPWKDLRERLPGWPHVATLSRFMAWVSAQGLGPEDVTSTDLERFAVAVERETLVPKPWKVAQRVARLWNAAIGTIPDWPATRLALPPRRPAVTVTWDALPPALAADAEAWLARLRGDDLFDLLAPTMPLRPATLVGLRFRLRQLYTPVAAGAVATVEPQSLADLVTPATLRAILEYWLDRNGGTPRVTIHTIARVGLAIARRWVRLPEAELETLRGFERRLRPKTHGMTEENRRRLAQFEDPRNLHRLLTLPARLMARAVHDDDLTIRPALLAQAALAIELLLMLPMRRANLRALELGRHLIRSRTKGSREVHLLIPAAEVKNSQTIEARLPPGAVDLLELYLARFHHRIGGRDCRFLFPGRDPDRPKHATQMSTDLPRLIFRETGLRMNLHLFRHLSAKIYLDAHPGDYETVRRLLGHRNINTTIAFYASLANIAAVDRYDRIVLGIRDDAA